jgi:septal ring factor EnvC (AmiA/AmiB activator)
MQETKKVLEETRKKKSSSLSQLKAINRQIQTREHIIANVQQQIAALTHEIEESHADLDSLKADLERLKQDYARSIQGAYRARNVYDKMLFVFSSTSFNQAIRRIRYLNQYSDYRQQQAKLILVKQNEVIAALNELIANKHEKMALINMKEDEKKELEGDKREESVVLSELQQKEKTLRRQLAASEKAARKLNRTIEELIAREIEEARRREEEARRKEEAARLAAAKKKGTPAPEPAKPTASKAGEMFLTPEAVKMSNDFENNKNNLPWPVEKGYISEAFGTHPHPSLRGVMVNNNGVNIATQPGAAVRCVFQGTVKAVFSVPGMGKIVLVNHGRYYTAYAKLASVNSNIREGTKLDIRDPIGTVLTDAEQDVTEVHFEVWNMDKKIDPEVWLKN